jgi:hypothetical protein
LDFLEGNFRQLDQAEGEVGDECLQAVVGTQIEEFRETRRDAPNEWIIFPQISQIFAD